MVRLYRVQYNPNAGQFLPIDEWVAVLPTLAYQMFFEKETDVATVELDEDIQRTLRAILRTASSPVPAAFLKSKTSLMRAWKGIDVRSSSSFRFVLLKYPVIRITCADTSDSVLHRRRGGLFRRAIQTPRLQI